MPLKEAIWIDVVASTKTPFTPFRRTGYVRLCFKFRFVSEWEKKGMLRIEQDLHVGVL